MKNIIEFLDEQSKKLPPGGYAVKEIDTNVSTMALLKHFCVPPLGAEYYFPDLFGKYGRTFTGICDGWNWFDDSLKDAQETDLWKMIAITALYWQKFYEGLADSRV